jgi:hypothetical protein
VIPPSVTDGAVSDPSKISVLQSQILESGFPGWWSSLAPDAQSWIIGIAGVAATVIPEVVSIEVAAGLTTIGKTETAPTATASSTRSRSNSTITTTSKATLTPAPTIEASSSPLPSKSSSAGAAPTHVAVAGILGAVGFLGLVVAL